MIEYKKIWADPVWSKVISAVIISLCILIFSFVSDYFYSKPFWATIGEILTIKIDIWVVAFVALLAIVSVILKRKPTSIKPSFSRSISKYFGVYEVYHFAPHTTGVPKLTKSFLQIDAVNTQYVHPLFECEEGEIDHIDGHIFLNLKNKEQKNAPSYFILKNINDAKISYLGGLCLGIGQNQNCHPIAVKLALVRRDEITDFSIEKYKLRCSIEDFPREKLQSEFYKNLVPNFLWNKCEDKDILF